ncbi:MAG: hypothetical protein Q9217_005303 [Psora testacea]
MLVSQDIEEIRTLLTHYQGAQNTSNIDELLELYITDAVLVAPRLQSATGREAIREAYGTILSSAKSDTAFNIEEIVPTAPDWAFARTISESTVEFKGKGKSKTVEREANHGLFILRKGLEGWKIARCCFTIIVPRPR